MLVAEAVIITGHPRRYLARLGKHTAKMGSGLHHRPRAHGSGHTPAEIRDTEWSAAGGAVTLNWGQWTAQTAPGTLKLRAEAADAENLQKIQDMLGTRLENFGKRENLTVTWQQCGTPAAEPGPAPPLNPPAANASGAARPPGPRGAQAAATLARFAAGRPLQACTSLFAQYGDTIYLPARPRKGLYIFSRPDQAEHILAARQDNYVKPFTYRPLRVLLGDGLLTADESRWRQHRRIIQPAFSSSSIASYAAQMDAAAQRAIRQWRGRQHIELADEMGALALDVAGQVLFGTDLAAPTPSPGPAAAAGQWLALLGALLPLRLGPRSSRVVRSVARIAGPGAVQQQVDKVISRSCQRPGAVGALIGLLTAARDANGGTLSDQEVRDEISTFLVAGSETTAMALTWSLALLSAYPDARDRLEEEANAVVGDGPANPGQLPWTTAVVSEAMRLYPPAWTLERTALTDDSVCGITVPAGNMVAVLPYLIHRNPAVWPNPAGFEPARFLPGAPGRHRYAWIPFGGGKRACIGASFARQEAVALLARICRHYRLDLASPALPPPRGHITLRPARPVPVRLTPRD